MCADRYFDTSSCECFVFAAELSIYHNGGGRRLPPLSYSFSGIHSPANVRNKEEDAYLRVICAFHFCILGVVFCACLINHWFRSCS